MKAVWEACSADGDEANILCEEAGAIRDGVTTARVADGYYELEPADREAWDTAYEETTTALIVTLVTAWLAANLPAAGEAGSTCSATAKCTNSAHCCGTATPDTTAVSNGASE